MIVCICHRVSNHDIERQARHGCADFDTLQDELRVATACGACADCARRIFGQACARQAESPRVIAISPVFQAAAA
jgi:bacterioferritin-associated ferredoxin